MRFEDTQQCCWIWRKHLIFKSSKLQTILQRYPGSTSMEAISMASSIFAH